MIADRPAVLAQGPQHTLRFVELELRSAPALHPLEKFQEFLTVAHQMEHLLADLGLPPALALFGVREVFERRNLCFE